MKINQSMQEKVTNQNQNALTYTLCKRCFTSLRSFRVVFWYTYLVYLTFHLVTNSQGTLHCSYMKYIPAMHLDISDWEFHFL